MRHALRLLPVDHLVWNAAQPIDPALRPLYGIDVAGRTCVFYSPEPLGCYWELDRPGRTNEYSPGVEQAVRTARAVGVNVMTYATDRKVTNKLAMPPVGDQRRRNPR